MSPGIVELKKVPNCAHLVISRNIYGEFSLWYVVFNHLEGMSYYISIILVILNIKFDNTWFIVLFSDVFVILHRK